MRSFVRREGRLTPGQQRALDTLWPRLGISAGPAIEPARLFGRSAPLEVEIGCGNGEALAQMATARPDHDFIGIEVYRPGLGKLLADIDELGLANVRLADRDAVEVVETLPAASVQRFWVLFPDPWPKKRHHKRRLLQAPFIAALASRLAVGGELVVATDWQPYAEFVVEVIEAEPALVNVHGRGGHAPDSGLRPLTKYERRGIRLGHDVFDIVARRRA